MKRTLFLILLLLVALIVHSQEPLPLLTPQQMPNPIHFLPPPPDSGSAAFAYDQSQYRWGKEQRLDSARLAIAVRDADWSINCICREFSEPFGMTDEEAAQMRRNSGRNVPSIPRTRPSRNNGEPWGMTDEEAAQMNDNYGMPMGMTDEEAAQMRKMQRQQRRARRR